MQTSEQFRNSSSRWPPTMPARLKCRLRLEATWTDDGSLEGTVEQKYLAVRAFGPFAETDPIELKPTIAREFK